MSARRERVSAQRHPFPHSETAVQKARKTRSVPGWILTKQLSDATKASEKDALRRDVEHFKAQAQEALESKTNQNEDFESAGPNLMRRAKQRSKSHGRNMASSKDRQHRQAASLLSSISSGSLSKAQALRHVKSKQILLTCLHLHCLHLHSLQVEMRKLMPCEQRSRTFIDKLQLGA